MKKQICNWPAPTYFHPSVYMKDGALYIHDLEIQLHPCPDTTYFHPSEVRPYIENGVLHEYSGESNQRHRDSPKCYSNVSTLGSNVIEVSVGWCHKHKWGRREYYFVEENGQWKARRKNHTSVLAALMLEKITGGRYETTA